ncbi:uncharacterized protein HKW66_Vig0209580 [Vigna angularis]|uniref:Uncharacterized protein n=1 Tax=Phaseolus angularis TaxID=3914 RepID=A0A8T0JHZ6_PHAAN|nr:uncharacterized protein HKW66_Vig0209580 [Vigna angularis]
MVKGVNGVVFICVGKEGVWGAAQGEEGRAKRKVTASATASSEGYCHVLILLSAMLQMIDDQDLGFFANFLGVFIFVLTEMLCKWIFDAIKNSSLGMRMLAYD